jgi:hypothetical protein
MQNMMKSIFEKAALVFFGIIVSVLALELGARLLPTQFLPPSLGSIVLELENRYHSTDPYLADPKLWYVIKPGTDFVFKHPDSDFRMKTNLNFPKAGFRGGILGGPAWGIAVGDSFTFGLGVNQELTWSAQLATLSGRDIINLGVPGWGPQQYTRTLEQYGLPLSPKIVFYGLFSNDVGNVTRFEKDEGHFNEFTMREFLRSHSVIFNLFRRLRRANQAVDDINLSDVGLKFSSASLKARILADSRRFREGWPLTKREIETAYHDSQRSNALFVLLYFPSKEEVYWDAIKKKNETLEAFNDRIDLLRKATMDFCQSSGLLCVDLTPILKKSASLREKVYFSVDSHWNAPGNRIVAEEIYKSLVAKKIL